MPRSTYYWQRTQRNDPVEARKRGPKTAFSDTELTERIRQEIAASPFTGEGHRKFWARVLRLMREAQMLAPQRQAATVVEQTDLHPFLYGTLPLGKSVFHQTFS